MLTRTKVLRTREDDTGTRDDANNLCFQALGMAKTKFCAQE